MFRYFFRRIVTVIPAVFGISLVTFVLVNLALDQRGAGTVLPMEPAADDEIADEFRRTMALHLPLFVNLSIEDVRTRTQRDIQQLKQPQTRPRAVRSLARTGAAAIPYLVPALPNLSPEARQGALDALDAVSQRIGNHEELLAAEDRAAFWARYHGVYGSDFTAARVSRLIRRYVRHNDELAIHELRRLDTFILPELMDAMSDGDIDETGRFRIVGLLCDITGRDDPYPTGASAEQKEETLMRWEEWWKQRYDLYTSFEGLRRMTGMITETRYFQWMQRVATLDFGVSARDGRPIRTRLAQCLPVTLLLSGLAMFLAYLVAIPMGVITAMKRGSRIDQVTSLLLFIGYSLPSFWVAMLALRYFAFPGSLEWFPAGGLSSSHDVDSLSRAGRMLDAAHHLFLPVLCLSFVSMAMLSRFQRAGMLRIVQSDFIRTARAKGLSEKQVFFRHVLRSSIIPLVTLMAVQMPFLISGSLVIEWVFNIPGMGLETFDAIQSADYAWIIAVVTVTGAITIVAGVLADVIYALVDPRIVPGRRTARSV